MLTTKEEKRYKHLSPFELKNKLLQMADTHHERMMLDAGRGNPNWVATVPRAAFFHFGHFAVEESARNKIRPNFGSFAKEEGLEQRFEEFLARYKKTPYIQFLSKAFDYVRYELKIDADSFVREMVDAVLGDHYPYPDRMLKCSEIIVHKYLEQELCAGKLASGKMELFPTEGGTAAMDYIFNSLIENKLLHKGDKIAIGTPIFTPYIEIPRLNDYEFLALEITQDENNDWQYSEKELAKLLDPEVKAFFLVHPSNPTAVCMHDDSLEKLGELVRTKRKDLILLTDDVYGTFINDFKSLMAIAPHNTILVYSYSKYFGATGWRLGVIAIHEDNIFDKAIANLPALSRKKLQTRYHSVALDPKQMKFIDRIVADSRSVALHHTAGLSTPQQVLMVFFSLYCLVDQENNYKKSAQKIVKQRFKKLYKALGIPQPENPYQTYYYTTIDIPKLAATRYSSKFANYLIKKFEPIDFVMRLAEEKSIVLLDGGGFDAPNMSVRVSLANLPDEAYTTIGKAISELLAEYYQKYKN